MKSVEIKSKIVYQRTKPFAHTLSAIKMKKSHLVLMLPKLVVLMQMLDFFVERYFGTFLRFFFVSLLTREDRVRTVEGW